MKKIFISLFVLLFCISIAEATAIVEDNFNSYTNGSVVGQGGWESYSCGSNFIVQGATVLEGVKALYNNSSQDSVIGKMGDLLVDGRQTVYVRTENRDDWNFSPSGNVQIRMTENLWSQQYGSFLFVSFYQDGSVGYNGVVFDTYNDNAWTLLEMEWRSSDATARCRVNNGTWTTWQSIITYDSFTGFDYVGFNFDNRGGSGGVYFDALGANPIPEPATISLLSFGFLLFRKKITTRL